MNLTAYVNCNDHSQTIICEWDHNGESYRFTTSNDIIDSEHCAAVYYSKFPNYAMSVPSWDELCKKVKISSRTYFDENNCSWGTCPANKKYFSARQLSDLARGENIVEREQCHCHPHIKGTRHYMFSKINSRSISVGSEY